MVCFPDMQTNDFPHLINCPKDIIITYQDLDTLNEKIFSYAKLETPLTKQQCLKIVKCLHPNFSTYNKLSAQTSRQLEIINNLTDEQIETYKMVKANRFIQLSGPAGSGKTILAIKIIKEYIQNQKKVLTLVPEGLLKAFYKNMIGPNNFICINQNELLTTNILHSILPDVIILDEAQDIIQEAWDVLLNVYNLNKVEKLLIIHDSNQKLKDRVTIKFPTNICKFQLNTMIRSTKQISKISSKFCNDIVNIKGPEGPDVQYIKINNISEIPNKIESVVSECINEDFDFKDITILFGDNNRRKTVLSFNTNNRYGFTLNLCKDGAKYKQPIIETTTIFQYRGLENNIIILTGLENITESQLKNFCYVGTSRARSLLYIIASESILDYIKSNKNRI